jgi:hypothetical protein
MLNQRHSIEIPSKKNYKKHAIIAIKSENLSNTSCQITGITFDPMTSTPPSDFMSALKNRMDVYFTQGQIESLCK